jgi:hypothetical protein
MLVQFLVKIAQMLVYFSSQGQGIVRVKLEIIFLVLVIKLLMQYQVQRLIMYQIILKLGQIKNECC